MLTLISTILVVGIIVIGACLFLKRKKGKKGGKRSFPERIEEGEEEEEVPFSLDDMKNMREEQVRPEETKIPSSKERPEEERLEEERPEEEYSEEIEE